MSAVHPVRPDQDDDSVIVLLFEVWLWDDLRHGTNGARSPSGTVGLRQACHKNAPSVH
jgi:hypothetical protein